MGFGRGEAVPIMTIMINDGQETGSDDGGCSWFGVIMIIGDARWHFFFFRWVPVREEGGVLTETVQLRRSMDDGGGCSSARRCGGFITAIVVGDSSIMLYV